MTRNYNVSKSRLSWKETAEAIAYLEKRYGRGWGSALAARLDMSEAAVTAWKNGSSRMPRRALAFLDDLELYSPLGDDRMTKEETLALCAEADKRIGWGWQTKMAQALGLTRSAVTQWKYDALHAPKKAREVLDELDDMMTIRETQKFCAMIENEFGRGWRKALAQFLGVHVMAITRAKRGEARLPKTALTAVYYI